LSLVSERGRTIKNKKKKKRGGKRKEENFYELFSPVKEPKKKGRGHRPQLIKGN